MEIYEKDLWLNPGNTNGFNKEIFEYDIQSAGLALAIKYDLLPKMVTDHLLTLPKEERVVEMGKMERSDRELGRKLKNAFVAIRKLFFESNGLDIVDIIAIKRDAIFTLRKCMFTEFDNVIFRVKNSYSSFMAFSNLEFYYHPEHLDVKGINPTELAFHKDFFLLLIQRFFRLKETESATFVTTTVRNWTDEYKWLRMEPEYYREFRPGGKYRLKNSGDKTDYPVFPVERLDELDISYNYLKILMKLALIAV